MEAIAKELTQRSAFLQDFFPVETIYFGGGTPSGIDEEWIFKILDVIFQNYSVVDNPEIALEANPDDLSPKYLVNISNRINRLSIGVQSFHNGDLHFLGRRHTAEKAKTAISDARKAGFNNISIDLIYGVSDSIEIWEDNIQTALSFAPEHISAYSLTVEERTLLDQNLKQGKQIIASEDFVEQQYELLINALNRSGYEHYEISNFAKPGFHSKHNSGYWNGAPYLGVGPAAHSFNGTIRRWNVAHIRQYCEGIANGISVFETEELSDRECYNEYVMLHLRTANGIDETDLKAKFGKKYREFFLQQAVPLIKSGQILREKTTFRIPETLFLLSDHIIAELFI